MARQLFSKKNSVLLCLINMAKTILSVAALFVQTQKKIACTKRQWNEQHEFYKILLNGSCMENEG